MAMVVQRPIMPSFSRLKAWLFAGAKSGSVGLDGKPRVRNESVDIGCYEYPFQGFLLMVR